MTAADLRDTTGSAEPRVLMRALLRPVDRGLRGLEEQTARFLPAALDPLVQAGAIANACLLVAIASGVLLLFWYVPSVHQAYGSMQAMDGAPFTSGLVRSLHRYSSDGCMLFVLLHALRVFAAGRFTGPRWLAWVTGLSVLALLWLVGYLGYWLVWDQRAQQVAVGFARMVDVVPIFTDLMERSFLADSGINTLLFFLVFFAHMLLPLAMGVGLWLHIARLNKARFLPGRALSAWVVGSLVLVSVAAPATVVDPATMAVRPTGFTMDYWYLLPVVLTDRLSGGVLWVLVLVPGALAFAAPWWMARGRIRPALADTARCNSCGQCATDCPFNAITMVPRTDGKDFPFQSQVDPARCVGCGICSGSCDSIGVGLLDWFPVAEQRRRLEGWAEADPSRPITLACAHAGGPRDERTLEVPCAGWIHALTLERLLRKGLVEVRVAACPDGDCRYRHGPMLLEERLAGERRPALRTDRIDADRIVVSARRRGARRGVRVLAGVAAALLLGGATWAVSDLPYALPARPSPELVVSFKHAGAARLGRPLTAAERAQLPPHLRKARTHVRLRERCPVRLRVRIDGVAVHEAEYPAGGVWSDGVSVALERLPVTPGAHRVEVLIGDTPDPAEWPHRAERSIPFAPHRRYVVLFDRAGGFRWELPRQ